MERPSWWARDLILLYLSVTAARIGFGVVIIIFPSYLLGTSDVTLAIVLALYPILEGLFAVPIGGLCDRRGRRIIFVSGLGTMALLTAAIGLTRNLWVVSGVHALMGIAAASITVSSLTMITDLTKVTNRGKGMGAFDFANIGGYAVGLILGGRLHDYFETNLSYPFYVTAIVMFAALLLSIVLLREPVHVSPRGRMELNPLKVLDEKTKAILPIWLSLTSLLGIVFFLPRAFTSLGFKATSTGDILFLGIIVLGLGSVGFGALSDVIGREKTIIIGVVGLFSLLVSLGLALQSGTSGPRFFEYLFILGPSTLAASALVPSILAGVGDRVKEEFRGASMGLYSLMLSFGIALGELLAGYAHSIGGMPTILEGGAVLFLLASISSFVLLRRVRRRQPMHS